MLGKNGYQMVKLIKARKSVLVLYILMVAREFWVADELKKEFGGAGATEVVLMRGWRTMALKTTSKTDWIVLDVRYQVTRCRAAQRLTSSKMYKMYNNENKTRIDPRKQTVISHVSRTSLHSHPHFTKSLPVGNGNYASVHQHLNLLAVKQLDP